MRRPCPSLARAAALAACLAPALAGAGNWTLGGTAFERLEADSNRRLREGGEALYGSSTGIDLELGYDAGRTVWALGSGAEFRRFVGPGDAEGLEGVSDPRASGSVEHRSRRQLIEAAFTAARRPVAFTLIDEPEALEDEALDNEAAETRLGLEGGWTVRLDPRTEVSLDTEVEARRFSEEARELVPSTSIELGGGVERALSARMEAAVIATLRRFTADGAGRDTASHAAGLGVRLTARPTRRHTIAVEGGLGHVWTDVSGADADDADTVGDGLVFNGALDLDWQATPRTALALTASQALESTAAGGLADTTRIAAGLDRRLTPRSRLAFGASLARRSGGDGDDGSGSRLARIESRLGVDLTRAWEAEVGMTLGARSGGADEARSAGVFLELRRAFVLNR